MTTEQQRRLQNALASDEAFLEFLAQEAHTSEFQAAQQRMEAGPHPTDTVLHEYVFGWVDAQDAAAIREHLSCCRTCAEEVLRFRQFEERRRQETQAWVTDAAQTAVASPPNTVSPWGYLRTFLQVSAMSAAVLALVYRRAIVNIFLQNSLFSPQQAAIVFGILLIGLFSLALCDMYRHRAPRFASGSQKNFLSGLCMLAFLAFILPTLHLVSDLRTPPPELSRPGTRMSGKMETAPIPEPGTMVLFGIGLLGLLGIAAKKNRRH
ncbi:MAG: PEP-CTERM sorting domain-containing protein [Candidatus Vecturithrix sp.]|nr:PEP-CTERM sorting domain-containing protein [Candidatus Vecturithrix sp.]